MVAQELCGFWKEALERRQATDILQGTPFCLLEALLEADRAFIRNAKTMVLLRDERHGRLVIRYAACTGDLETRRGTLAVVRDYDSPTADNIVKATKQAFKQFCTLRVGRPRSMPRLAAPETDQDLLLHMRRITEMIVSDSASSELLAAEISRGRRGVETDKALTPTVKGVGRDSAHCARWVLKKPWQADLCLSTLFEKTVWHETSVIQIIDRSDVFRQWFREYCGQAGGKPSASNLSSAKHRFESCSKPLRRLILHLVAVFKTCHRIAITRDSSHEGGLVRRWLTTVSSEDLLQLALLADATDEGLLLVRQMDTEQLDLATLLSTVEAFTERVDYLFNQGGCMTVENSFTQHCMSLLGSGQLQVLPRSEKDGEHWVLGRPSEEAVRRCTSRMSIWAKLAKTVVDAEFPDFLALNAFAVFALSDEERAVVEGPVNETHCQRLAKLFSVDPQGLASQLARLRPTAQAIKNSSKCSNHEAWQKAVQRTKMARAGLGATLEALQKVVMRYLVWSSSTAGVEQRFSVGDRLAIEKSPASQLHESLALRAAFDKVSPAEQEAVARRAQELFAEGCPCARPQARGPRRDKGTKRLSDNLAQTEAGWLRRRRGTVAAGAKARPSSATGSRTSVLTQHLQQEHRKCLVKQQEKKQRLEEQAFQDGYLLDHEVTDELRARVEERRRKDRANDMRMAAETKRKERKVAMMGRQVPWFKLRGLKAWVDTNNIQEGDAAVVRSCLFERGVSILGPAGWAEAELFLVPCLKKDSLRQRILWRAVLSGCWLLSVSAAHGQQGIFVKYKAALQKAFGFEREREGERANLSRSCFVS